MSDGITRRQFLRDSAMVLGAAVLVDPRRLFGNASVVDHARRIAATGPSAGGLFTLVEHGDPGDEFLVRGTRLGGDYMLELSPAAVVFHSPTRSTATPEVISLAAFGLGLGHDVIAHNFGPEAVDQLRTEVTQLQILGLS